MQLCSHLQYGGGSFFFFSFSRPNIPGHTCLCNQTHKHTHIRQTHVRAHTVNETLLIVMFLLPETGCCPEGVMMLSHHSPQIVMCVMWAHMSRKSVQNSKKTYILSKKITRKGQKVSLTSTVQEKGLRWNPLWWRMSATGLEKVKRERERERAQQRVANALWATPLLPFQISGWRFVWSVQKKEKEKEKKMSLTMRTNPSFCLSTVHLPLQFPPRVSGLCGLHTDCSC